MHRTSTHKQCRRGRVALLLGVLALVPLSCAQKKDAAQQLRELEADRSITLPCASKTVHVIFTEAGIPHIFGENDDDVACAHGYIAARDRYFEMELAARAGLGTLSEIFGNLALATDHENRSNGMRAAAERLLAYAAPDWRKRMQLYAQGVNAYVAEVHAGKAAPPSEFDILAPLALKDDAAAVVNDWDELKVVGVAAVVLYESGFSTRDLRFQAGTDELATWGADLPDAALRQAAARADVMEDVAPIIAVSSAQPPVSASTLSPTSARTPRSSPASRAVHTLPARRVPLAAAAAARGARWTTLLKGLVGSQGSNAWAVAPTHSRDGRTILASDGHLTMSVPTFFYSAQLNTRLLGGGDLDFSGMALPGLPMMGPGTNGDIAWSQTKLFADMVDWYDETLYLDNKGRPTESLTPDGRRPVSAITENYELPDGSTSTIERFVTASGRPLYAIEGSKGREGDSRSLLIGGEWIRPGDSDGDGRISGLSFAYGARYERNMLNALGGFVYAKSVDEMLKLFSNSASYGGILTMIDKAGHIANTGWLVQPCRAYLDKGSNGRPLPGANPEKVIDASRYPSWYVRYDSQNRILLDNDDPLTCHIPFADFPLALDEDQGFVLNANNDISGASFDGNLWNQPYLGGPWDLGFRSDRISALLAARSDHDTTSMAAIQSDHRSNVAHYFWPLLQPIVDRARTNNASEATASALWQARSPQLNEVYDRLTGWASRSYPALSGVDTFYNQFDKAQKRDAVATTLWNAWFYEILRQVFDDEALPDGIFRKGGTDGKERTLYRMLKGRRPGASILAGIRPENGEHVFWDDAATPATETATEIVVRALALALDFLASDPADERMRSGGFGSNDMDSWLWGRKHMARFDSILKFALGDAAGSLFDAYGITTKNLPLTDSTGDPFAKGLQNFPRNGEQHTVDAAKGGAGDDWTYGLGPVMRLVISLGKDGSVRGQNVLPGGQSGINDSAHFADQAALWLANKAIPVYHTPNEVLAKAKEHWVLKPR